MARSDVPVYVAHIVAILVFTHFREDHSTTFECGVILSGKNILGESAGLDLDLPDFFYELGSFHQSVGRIVSVVWSFFASGHFDLVEYLRYDLVGSDIVGFGFIAEPDAVAHHVVAHCSDILGYHVASLTQEGVGAGGFGHAD